MPAQLDGTSICSTVMLNLVHDEQQVSWTNVSGWPLKALLDVDFPGRGSLEAANGAWNAYPSVSNAHAGNCRFLCWLSVDVDHTLAHDLTLHQ